MVMLLWILEHLAPVCDPNNGGTSNPAGHVSFSYEISTYGTAPQSSDIVCNKFNPMAANFQAH